MSTKFIGFGVSKGTFINEKTGESVAYSNRALRFETDDAADNKTEFGYTCYEEPKVKASLIANSLGISENDEVINNALKNMLGKEVEVLRVPKNNTLVCIGIRLAHLSK